MPILADGNMNIVAGVGRWLAAESLGYSEVPVVRLDHLSEAQAKALRIAENRLSETSTWDDRLLAESLKELAELELDFDLEATGFEMPEIDLRIEALNADSKDDEIDQKSDALPEPNTCAVSKRGDLWVLREHRVFNGDALEARAFQSLLQGQRAAMGFTDPPYNVRIDGHASGLGTIHHREFEIGSGEMTAAQFTSFLTTALSLLAGNSANGAILFVCMDWRHMAEVLSASKASDLQLKNICVWTKHNAGMGSLYRSGYENVLVLKSGRAPHRNNVELGKHGRNRSNVWSYPSINNFGKATDEGHLLALHPTVKPVRLVADAILDCSARGEIVLDSFLGSGTTVVAAQRTGRRCYGIEIDPLYVDTAIRRWQAYTGDYAAHAVSGKRFDEIAAAVEMRHA